MAVLEVKCPECKESKVVKYGKERKDSRDTNVKTQNVKRRYFSLSITTTGAKRA